MSKKAGAVRETRKFVEKGGTTMATTGLKEQKKTEREPRGKTFNSFRIARWYRQIVGCTH